MGKLACGSYPLGPTAREEFRAIDSRTLRLIGSGGDYALKLRLIVSGVGVSIRIIPSTPQFLREAKHVTRPRA